MDTNQIQLGILGAGQLGKMLAQSYSRWGLPLTLLDKSEDFPASALGNRFITGDFTQKDDVIQLAEACSHVTIEIEKVNIEGLRTLQSRGLTVHPDPDALSHIVDKGLQKQFMDEHNIATSKYRLVDTSQELIQLLSNGELPLPCVIKSRTGGYDGYGVQILKAIPETTDLIDGPYLVEEMVDIAAEISVIAVANASGDCRTFPAVEMVFDPDANLVDYLVCPANISKTIESEASRLAQRLIRAFNISGLLAVEMFYTTTGELYVNEVAPRPHNSGHHTIEACNYSQFEMHLRGILNLPLPEIQLLSPAAMINLLGSGSTGSTYITGLPETLALPDTYVHIYGKSSSRPGRKMGHVTLLADSREELLARMKKVRNQLTIQGKPEQ